MKQINRTSPIIIAVTVACILLLVFVSRSSVTKEVNLVIQETLIGGAGDEQTSFVLMEFRAEESDSTATLEMLLKYKPKRLFWLLPDQPLPASFLELIEAFEIKTIKIPSRVFSSQGNIVEVEQTQWQPSAGYLINITPSLGGARKLPVSGGTTESPLLSPVATLHPEIVEQQRVSYINYSGLALNTPFINTELSAFEAVVSQTINNKDIYLLPSLDLLQASVILPHHDGEVGWHPMQYHALALSALESDNVFQNYTLWLRILIVVVMTLSLYLAFLWVLPKFKRIAVVSLVFTYLVAGLMLSNLLGFISPSVEMLFSIALFFVLIESFFSQTRRTKLAWVARLLTGGVAKRLTDTKRSQSFWDNVADLVTQNLNLDRCIFLDLPRGGNHLSEISAVNCSLEDINEMRRDYRREPYLSAFQSKQAVISNRPYFKNKPEGSVEILAPFFKGTTVLGFWALLTKEQNAEKLQQLKEQVNWFALQISTLLDAQQTAIAGEHRSSKIIRRYGCEENEALQTIGNRLTGLLTNVTESASFFESMATPGVLFDVFGQLSLVNDAMHHLGHKEDIPMEDMTAYEFLARVLPVQGEPLRNIINQLTTEANAPSQRFLINLSGIDYLLVLSSVQKDVEQPGKLEVKHRLQGLMCELLSLKEIQDYLEIERGLYNNYVIKIKNYLSTLQMGLLQVERKSQEALIKEIGLYLNLELQKASDITRRTHYFMKRVSDRRHVNAIPFNPVQILQSLVNQSQKKQQEYPGWRDVRFNLNLPTFASMGLGAPELYKKLVFAGMKLLADDAVSPKQVNVVAKHIVRDDLEVLYIKLTSEGYGLPNEQLQKLYEQSAASNERSLLSEFLVHLRAAKDVGMECRLKSRVGKGYRLSILIEGIGLHDD